MPLRLRNLIILSLLCTFVSVVINPTSSLTDTSSFAQDINRPQILTSKNSPDSASLLAVDKGESASRALMGAPSPITNYTITAFLQDWSHNVTGHTIITYVNHAEVAFSELYFHLYPNAFLPEGGMEIFDVMYTGQPLGYTIAGIDQTVLAVDLVGGSGPGLLLPNGIVTLTIDWQVTVPESGDRFGWLNRTDPFDFLAYNMGNWHPIVAVYDDRGWDTKPYSHMGESFYCDVATYNVTVTVPADYIVAATGELQSIQADTTTKDWHFTTGPVRDFTWCASPNYDTASLLTQGINVTSYYVADHSLAGARVLEVAEQCLEIYGNLFGPYPWESLAIVEADIWAGGMEYPQLVMIGLPLYWNPEGLSSLAYVTAHEIGHEWIPFTIGTDSYTEPWIDEGFASFTEYVWIEYSYGLVERMNYRQTDLDQYWDYVDSEGDKSVNQSMAYWQTADWYAYGRIVYAKSALLLDMLRHQLGNQTFYEAWQYIYSETIHQNIRTHSLQDLFEVAIGESLDWFFNPWIYGSGVITLGIGAYTLQQNESGWVLTFQLQQYQPTPVRLRVPVSVNFGLSSDIAWVWMEAQSITTHELLLSASPVQLTLDPERLLVCQYQLDFIFLGLFPGALIPLAIGGVVAAAVLVGVIIFVRQRRSK
ncbi:MAG: M1 family metallopeptidase [Promethearchaeota archaeon]